MWHHTLQKGHLFSRWTNKSGIRFSVLNWKHMPLTKNCSLLSEVHNWQWKCTVNFIHKWCWVDQFINTESANYEDRIDINYPSGNDSLRRKTETITTYYRTRCSRRVPGFHRNTEKTLFYKPWELLHYQICPCHLLFSLLQKAYDKTSLTDPLASTSFKL